MSAHGKGVAAAGTGLAQGAGLAQDSDLAQDAGLAQGADPALAELVAAAHEAQGRAYAPYSRFRVGAAVRTADGRIFTGANIENASYGLTVCAERNAVMQAVLAGARRIVAAAVVTDLSPPAAPCGMCRQVISEFAADCPILLCSVGGERQVVTLGALLPLRFGPSDLLPGSPSERPAAQAGTVDPGRARAGQGRDG